MRDHLPEYLAEFFGTAIMMTIGIGAITLMWGQGSPLRSIHISEGLRRLLTGILFAGGGTLVVLSPLGQRSGGHLNPAVSWAFWWKGQMKAPDAIMYTFAQCLGAILGVAIVALVGGAFAKSVQLGLTVPGNGYSPMVAFVAEAGITFLLMFLILYCVNDARVAAKTPYLAGAFVALLVFLEAPISGTSLNPARSFGPALWTQLFQFHWIYWIAPVMGAMAAVPAFGWLFREKRDGGCAKLFHTEHYRCIFAKCEYTQLAAGAVLLTQGDASDKAYVVERGELEVRKRGANGTEQVLARLGPGDWVGEMSLLLNLPRSATVIATRDSQLRTVTAANFTHVIKEHPEETLRLLKQLSARLSAANDKMVL
jgi:aquaporin Z